MNKKEEENKIEADETIKVAGTIDKESEDDFLIAYRTFITAQKVKQLADRSKLYNGIKDMIDKEVDEYESRDKE